MGCARGGWRGQGERARKRGGGDMVDGAGGDRRRQGWWGKMRKGHGEWAQTRGEGTEWVG